MTFAFFRLFRVFRGQISSLLKHYFLFRIDVKLTRTSNATKITSHAFNLFANLAASGLTAKTADDLVIARFSNVIMVADVLVNVSAAFV